MKDLRSFEVKYAQALNGYMFKFEGQDESVEEIVKDTNVKDDVDIAKVIFSKADFVFGSDENHNELLTALRNGASYSGVKNADKVDIKLLNDNNPDSNIEISYKTDSLTSAVFMTWQETYKQMTDMKMTSVENMTLSR